MILAIMKPMTKAKRAKIEKEGRKLLSTIFAGELLEAALEGFMEAFPEKPVDKKRKN